MKYTIEWLERKRTSTGKDKIDATLSDGKNSIDVTIWDNFPNFTGLMAGQDVEGDVVTKQNGQYTNKTLYPVKVATTPKFGASGVSKLMDKKAEQIEKAQERKSESIAYFNSVNSAIALVGKRLGEVSEAQMKLELKLWRDWFLSEYENWNAKEPF